jgi:hypothetical protein
MAMLPKRLQRKAGLHLPCQVIGQERTFRKLERQRDSHQKQRQQHRNQHQLAQVNQQVSPRPAVRTWVL